MDGVNPRGGWIEVITGGMFSGKSEELIRRIRRAEIARQRAQIFKPAIDNRFDLKRVISRDNRGLDAIVVNNTADLRSNLMNAVEITRKLIAIPSISGNEKAVAEFLAAYLEAAGFDVELQDAGDDRPNVYARRGEPDVVLSTHTDTVPPYVELREDEDYIYGRGACDTKGIIAAMLKAADLLIELKVTDFGLLFVVGEEAGSI